MNGRIQGRRTRIRRFPSVAASLLTELNPFLVNVTGQSGYGLNGPSSGASNVWVQNANYALPLACPFWPGADVGRAAVYRNPKLSKFGRFW